MKIPILLYHDIQSPDCPNEKIDDAARGTVVDATEFEEQIKYLVENGYETISVDEYFKYKEAGKDKLFKKLIITFDDGHYSNYRLAYPILLRYGFRGTFFIVAGKVNQKHHITQEQLKEMAEKSMEIGSHGLTHKYFPLMDDNEVAHELSESKSMLESITGKKIDYFAFPGGHYNKKVLTALRTSGFKGACSCLQGLNSKTTGPYLLRRIEIRGNLTAGEFRNIFSPLNIFHYQFIDLIKNLLRRSVGLETYSNIRKKLYKYYLFKR